MLFDMIAEAAQRNCRVVEYMNNLQSDTGVAYDEQNTRVIKDRIFGIDTTQFMLNIIIRYIL